MGSAHPEETRGFPEDAIFIVGAGHFGNRAARLISRTSRAPLFVLDIDGSRLAQLHATAARLIQEDGIQFLVGHDHLLCPSHTIVPALPHHLAFEWLRQRLAEEFTLERLPVPESIREELPHTWPASDGSLLVSYADFVCPDDCPEPEQCTVTGERRHPLYDVLAGVALADFQVHVIRSRQLAPGLGGYRMADLLSAAQRVAYGKRGNWLLATSCRCHGVITAFEIRGRVA